MISSEEQRARDIAGAANQDALEAIARHLHANESLHMHQRIEDKAPCEYCWLRAGNAILALRIAGLPVVLGPDPVQAAEPVEVEAAVLHELETLAARGKRGEVHGWTVVSGGSERTPWSDRLLVFRSQDRRHYGVTFANLMHADPADRVACHPVTAHYEVQQTARYQLAEAVNR
ncbi:hypothetical protein [Actinomadura geliboluensis]|uniref:hypothetical protein n=1 Tax=Actinomadura geliboluensis TaxID=882440 RepID=UPI0036BE534F